MGNKRWLVLWAAVGVLACLAGSAATAAARGVTYRNRGAYTWKVPEGVTRARFDLYGAEGGSGQTPVGNGSTGGLGAHVRAAFVTIPGQTYTIVVGGRGGDGAPAGPGPGGFPGGGSPGGPSGCRGGGGGGGGESDVRTGTASNAGLGTRLLIAGGGGGAGAASFAGAPPEGNGGDAGRTGRTAPASTVNAPIGWQLPAPTGGGGGTHIAGGPGGVFGDTTGGDGSRGVGGVGADGSLCNFSNYPFNWEAGGGGGGGGFFGGGGGAPGYAQTVIISTSPTGGGGGSSFITRKAVCRRPIGAGVHKGDGLIVITYNPRHC